MADERIETDTEKVWRFMEDDLIPELEKRLTDKYGVDGLVEAQPLFNRLQIDINMSEIDRDLGFRQERISTAEALQEDIYFYLLDWFKTYGERECGHELDNVGLIMPEPEIRTGRQTEFTAVMYDDLAGGAVWKARARACRLMQLTMCAFISGSWPLMVILLCSRWMRPAWVCWQEPPSSAI